jgi:hypothetical protein
MYKIDFKIRYYIMGREVAKQISDAFWEIRDMQVGLTIGQLLSKSKMQILFAIPARH